MEEVPNFQLFSSQNSDLDNEQLDEIEQKAQAKNTKRATEWGVKKFEKWCEKRKITVDLKTVSLSATDLSEILRKFFAEVKTWKDQALTPSALTGIRAAIHRHLTCAPLSRNTDILQDSELMSANKMFEAGRPSYLRKKTMRNQNTNHPFSQETCRNESILHGRAEHGRRLERCREVSLFGFRCVFILLAAAEGDGGSLQGSHLK